jgi:hypothetical protein
MTRTNPAKTLAAMILASARLEFREFLEKHHFVPKMMVEKHAREMREVLSPVHQCTNEEFVKIARYVHVQLDRRGRVE